MELLNKVAIITGAARGIGFEIAQCFAEGGASVILVDRAGAETAATRLAARGLDASFRTLDITDMEAVDAAWRTSSKKGQDRYSCE
jgi:NAD(P)-dependent dehydrogenase (short-subunit alcohol dehydrogenase family)